MADNEVLVLIYETMQKQLGQMKDSRVVIQSLANRTAALEETLKSIDERTGEMSERLDTLEQAVVLFGDKTEIGLDNTAKNNFKLSHTVDAMRTTIDSVVTPSVTVVANAHKDIKAEIRELAMVHKRVMDEFEQYELRMVQLEDIIKKMLNDQLQKPDKHENSDEIVS